MSESQLQYRQLAEACYIMLQATVYDFPNRTPEAHPVLRALFDVSYDDDEYNTMLDLLMRMLRPEVMLRASVREALESQLFADV